MRLNTGRSGVNETVRGRVVGILTIRTAHDIDADTPSEILARFEGMGGRERAIGHEKRACEGLAILDAYDSPRWFNVSQHLSQPPRS